MNKTLLVIGILLIIFALTLWAHEKFIKGLCAATASVLTILISWYYPGTVDMPPKPPESIEDGVENNGETEVGEPNEPNNSGETEEIGKEEDAPEIEAGTESESKEDDVEKPETSTEQSPQEKLNVEETPKVQPTSEYKEKIEIKESYLENEDGWKNIGKRVAWGEWIQTEVPKYMQSTDTYEVREIRSEITKKQYGYYNWWYYKGNVKMFSSDNNGGTIPQEQYWEGWFDYSMESAGYVKQFDEDDGAEFWWNRSNNDCRYYIGEKVVVVQPALFEEREGTYIYKHQRTALEKVN